MMSDVLDCSVVIRAFNEERHIGRLLSGILQQTVRPREIILVDSGSTDATLSVAAQFPVEVVTIRPEEFSFGRSLNRGIAASSGAAVVIASAHVYPVYADWLEQLLKGLDDPCVAVAYGQQRGNSLTRFSEHRFFVRWYPPVSVARQDHPFCNNANAAIRRELWAGHPYDEALPGLEDLEWATWAMSQGHAVGYRAEAPVVHVHEESPRMVYNRYRREAIALRAIHPSERFHLWDFVRLYAANVASDMVHAGRQRVLAGEVGGILWFRWMQFWGTYRGFAHGGPLSKDLKRVFYYPRGLEHAGVAEARPAPRVEYDTRGREREDGGSL